MTTKGLRQEARLLNDPTQGQHESILPVHMLKYATGIYNTEEIAEDGLVISIGYHWFQLSFWKNYISSPDVYGVMVGLHIPYLYAISLIWDFQITKEENIQYAALKEIFFSFFLEKENQ